MRSGFTSQLSQFVIALGLSALLAVHAAWSAEPGAELSPPATSNEARGRARLLHELVHATLQIVHHEYYREDEALKLPAASMNQVFGELAKRQKAKLRWLAVNAQAMNVDHEPRDEFEKQAARALAAGKIEFEQAGEGEYRYAGPITLTSDCLKCHLPNRKSNQNRSAALVITMPLAKP
jgi:hypothetical protein